MKFPKLFTPIKINSMVSRNRIVATPAGPNFEEKALGGAGIVIAGHTIVDPGRSSFASPDEPYIFHKYSVEEAQSRIRKTHQAGAKVSIELFHGGLYARVKDYAIGPNEFIREDGVQVKAMDEVMMLDVANKFAQAALDAKNLGFDMVFMHFGHGWLPAQFLSPLFNKRSDEYGGSLENRSKFPKLILEKVREAVGPHYPVDMRISAIEWVDGSIEFEDTLNFIKSVEHLIDTVQISAGLDINHEANVHMVTTNFSGHKVNAKFAREVKKHVKIPVSTVGAVLNPQQAEELLEAGDVDFVAFGRSFIADPDWPNKAKEGREEDIMPCIRCMQCYHIASDRKNVGCSVNPRYRNEDFVIKRVSEAEIKKKIVVIGAGPAGLMAATTAAKRGHEVILVEKEDHVGGQLHYIAMDHHKKDIEFYLNHLKAQLYKSTVDVRLNTKVTQDEIKALNPDVVFVAIGASPFTPSIPGKDLPHVVGFIDAITDGEHLGENVVIIGGGTIGAEIGLELTEFKRKNVHIVEMTDTIAVQGNNLYKIALRQKMDAQVSLHVHLKTQVLRIEENQVVIKTPAGLEETLKVDSVVLATGLRADRAQANSFYAMGPDVYLIGDCEKPRKIMEAVFEGYTIASRI